MWQIMHWLVGIWRVNSCLIGWPDSLCEMVGSACADMPMLPNLAYTAEWNVSRSFAYTTWHDEQPDERKSPGLSLVPIIQMNGSFKRVLTMFSTGMATRCPVPGPRLDCLISGRPGSSRRWISPDSWGKPISGKIVPMLRPPRSNTRNRSAGGVVSHDGIGAIVGSTPCLARLSVISSLLSVVTPTPSRLYASPRTECL